MEPDLNRDDQLPPDPLLKSGAFIDVIRNAETKSPMKTKQDVSSSPVTESKPTLVDSSVPTFVTPVSQWRPDSAAPQESSERPDWLPEDWKFERRVRASGASAGVVDRYYISPTGTKFRSKTEVLHFLETGSRKKETGSRKKRELNPESGSGSAPAKEKPDAKEKPERSVRKKKSKENGKEETKDFSNLNFDFKNPPQSTTWVPKDESNDEWTPVVENAVVPETDQTQWSNAFARLTELEKSDGVVL